MTYLNNAHSRDDRMRSILRTWEQYLISRSTHEMSLRDMGKLFDFEYIHDMSLRDIGKILLFLDFPTISFLCVTFCGQYIGKFFYGKVAWNVAGNWRFPYVPEGRFIGRVKRMNVQCVLSAGCCA